MHRKIKWIAGVKRTDERIERYYFSGKQVLMIMWEMYKDKITKGLLMTI